MKKQTVGSLIVVVLVGFVGWCVQGDVIADPQFNAQRVDGEPQWEGRVFLFGEEKAKKDATPILERAYRPLHFYGNMQRRHHYRDTVIPSRTDRSDRRSAFLGSR
jgi:hypothetical protein